MSEKIIWDLSVGLVQIFKNSPKSVHPKFLSLMFEFSSWNLDFIVMPWNLNTTSFGAIFLPREDEEDVIISTQRDVH